MKLGAPGGALESLEADVPRSPTEGFERVELVNYVRVLRRRWLVIALAVVVCGGVAYALSVQTTAVYATSARLVVSSPQGGGAVSELSNRELAVTRAAAYATYASTGPAVDAALQGAGYPAGTPRPTVTGTADGQTPFLSVGVTDADPVKAAAVANAYATQLLGVVARLDATPQLAEQTLAVVDPAGVPETPVSPRPVRDALFGLMLGLVLGVGTAFVREALDRTFTDADVLETETGLSVLGVVPEELEKISLPALSHPTSGRAEAYRTIRTNIQFAGPPASLKRIIVTSATPGEGKTSVSTNVAVAMARQGQSVILIDADLRRPSVTSAFGLTDRGRGLADVLADGADLVDVLVPVDEGALAVIPAGRQVENPSELLGGTRMSSLLEELSMHFDVVLVDTPPVLPVTDALVLAVGATSVIVVVRLGKTGRERLRRGLGSLRKLDVPILGIVANGSVPSGDAAYGYGSRYGYANRSKR